MPSSQGPTSRGVAVTYHHGVVERFADPVLERNFQTLEDFREFVQGVALCPTLSLRELADGMASSTLPANAVAVTFDDGYANNLPALEILAAACVPAALFVSTGALGPGRTIWPAELSLLLLHGAARRIAALSTQWPLADRDSRVRAYDAIRRRLKRLPTPERGREMDAIRAQFPPEETARLLAAFPSLQMLTWEQVGELARAGVEIGSHGVDHELHHHAQPGAIREAELRRSKQELEARLGRSCTAFAYPNGDFVVESPDEVRAAGYEMAFTIEPGRVTEASDPCQLPRLKNTAPAATEERRPQRGSAEVDTLRPH